jgi:HTH-type transcriptional regulator, quorum sensing regulator NprR
MNGYRIKQLRKFRGLTQKELAEGIISDSYISKLEKQNLELPDYLIDQVSTRLNIPVSTLLGEDQKIIKDKLRELLVLIYRNHLQDSKNLIEQLRDSIDDYIDEDLHIELNILLCLFYLKSGKLEKVKEYIQVIEKSSVKDYPPLLFRYLRVLGSYKYSIGEFNHALSLYEEALTLRKSVEDQLEYAYLIFNTGLVYLKLHDYQKTYYYIEKAESLFIQLGKWLDLADVYLVHGVVYYQQKQWTEALEYFQKVLVTAEEFNIIKLKIKALHNMGMVYEQLKQKKEAINHIEKSIKLCNQINDFVELPKNYLSLMTFHFNNKDFDGVEKYLCLLEEVEDLDQTIYAKKELLKGKIHKRNADIDAYIFAYKNAIDALSRNNRHLTAAQSYFELAQDTHNPEFYKEAAILFDKHFH